MQEALFNLILKTTFTVDDAYRRLGLVRRFLETAFFAGDGTPPSLAAFEVMLTGAELPADTVRHFRAWGEAWFPKIVPESLHESIEAVRVRIDDTPTVSFVVPVELPLKEREGVGQWVRTESGGGAALPMLFIDLLVDPRTVGGCRIVRGGSYRDFSLRYFIEQHRAEVTEALRGILV